MFLNSTTQSEWCGAPMLYKSKYSKWFKWEESMANWTYSVLNLMLQFSDDTAPAERPSCPRWGNCNNIHCHTAYCICTWGHCWIMQLSFGWGKSISPRWRRAEMTKVTPVIMWEQHSPLTQWWDSTGSQAGLRWGLIAPYWKMEPGCHECCCLTDGDMHQ